MRMMDRKKVFRMGFAVGQSRTFICLYNFFFLL